jgi:hypothetical protein
MEPERSLTCSQEFTDGHCPDPLESSLPFPTLFP